MGLIIILTKGKLWELSGPTFPDTVQSSCQKTAPEDSVFHEQEGFMQASWLRHKEMSQNRMAQNVFHPHWFWQVGGFQMFIAKKKLNGNWMVTVHMPSNVPYSGELRKIFWFLLAFKGSLLSFDCLIMRNERVKRRSRCCFVPSSSPPPHNSSFRPLTPQTWMFWRASRELEVPPPFPRLTRLSFSDRQTEKVNKSNKATRGKWKK